MGWLRWGVLLGATLWNAAGCTQEAAHLGGTDAPAYRSGGLADESIRELREQVHELQASVAAMRQEIDEMRANAAPRNAVLRNAVAVSVSAPNRAPEGQVAEGQTDGRNGEHGATLEEEYQLLSGKVDDQYQTKVESASKYRLRVSGIVLANLFSNQGAVDNIDFPTYTYARTPGNSGGSFGATVRQSELGFEAFGPTVAGAKTRADLQLDLAGGFPAVANGVNAGLMRLRTATMRMDWENTSLVAGQDAIFFSPNAPTSFASLALPALSSAGNLWAWVPQIRVEHRFALGEESSLLWQGGILDPVGGEAPYTGSYRVAGPGESSRQPAYATRIAWTRNFAGQPLRLGAGAYYSRQNYGFGQDVDAWAGMADLELPLGREFSLSGKAYRGRGLGGLYSGFGQSAVFSGLPNTPGTEVRGLNSVGGWTQLKYRPANKWEFNAAFGVDNPYAHDLEFFAYPYLYGGGYVTLARNQGSFVNMIYRPRSDLLFSAEYRHLTTYSLTGDGNGAGHLNLMMGVLF
jgi:hypothetical protein